MIRKEYWNGSDLRLIQYEYLEESNQHDHINGSLTPYPYHPIQLQPGRQENQLG